ncbi:hypothetical protein [uncultured Pontibacter sp.]|uniref:hypothetical protein n=1 Tax=uncultured Pontibacter sp. TaxID=453356 RepID=UPI00260857D6|nr:hypothetical protein [uncultured Pontibacter sp.]
MYKLNLLPSIRYCLLLPLLFFTHYTFGQVHGYTTVCPNEEVSYTDDNAPNGTATWTVTGGTFTSSSSGNDLKTVKIKWNNTTTQGAVKITVPITDKPSYTKSLNVGIKSVNGETPNPIRAFLGSVEQPVNSINGSRTFKLEWCEGRTYTFISQRQELS